jgi:lipopolysaccharide transport system ATP-binding protein
MAEACSRTRTVLFVSHNLAAIDALCNRVIVMQQGRLAFTGTAKEAISYYLQSLSDGAAVSGSHIVDLSQTSNRQAKYRPLLKKLELYSEDKPLGAELPIGAPLKAVIQFHLEETCASFDAAIAFDTPAGQRISTAHSAYEPDRVHEPREGEQVFVCEIPSLPLIPGVYKLHVGLYLGGNEVDWVEDVARLTLIRSDFYGTGFVPTKGVFLVQNRWALAGAREEVSA